MVTKVSAAQGDRSHSRHPAAVVITDARGASSVELSGRVRRYTYAMAFRMACFLGMVFVEGWLRWTLLAFAVFLPYVAVVLANQADERTTVNEVEHGAPEDAPQLTVGDQAEVIPGDVVEDEPFRTAA
jgi:type III secretory pathway component EscV